MEGKKNTNVQLGDKIRSTRETTPPGCMRRWRQPPSLHAGIPPENWVLEIASRPKLAGNARFVHVRTSVPGRPQPFNFACHLGLLPPR